MTVDAKTGSLVHVLDGVMAMLVNRLGATLGPLATSTGLTLPDPPQGAVYAGRIEDLPGVWPAVGVFNESASYETAVSPCYRVQHTFALTVTFAEGYVGAATPTDMQRAATAYTEAVARTVTRWAPVDLLGRGIYRAEFIDVVPADSPFIVRATSGEQWTVRAVMSRVRLYQTVQKEEG